MYLTRIDREFDHRQVMGLFPMDVGGVQSPRSEWGILFRANEGITIIQSAVPPDGRKLPPNIKLQTIKAVVLHPYPGEAFVFRLKFSPVIQSKNKITGKYRRSPIDPIDWLNARAEALGATFDIKSVSEPIVIRDKADDRPVVFVSRMVEGYLTITDPDRFKQTLINGVGREKAYGQGLLSIIPIQLTQGTQH
jgi:CRISPR system Cascade subunit CasE